MLFSLPLPPRRIIVNECTFKRQLLLSFLHEDIYPCVYDYKTVLHLLARCRRHHHHQHHLSKAGCAASSGVISSLSWWHTSLLRSRPIWVIDPSERLTHLSDWTEGNAHTLKLCALPSVQCLISFQRFLKNSCVSDVQKVGHVTRTSAVQEERHKGPECPG